ncbi:MAG: peptidoglycan editing factor PgeF [Alphaproteobacteria bacterium]|nr:peptidoglycan editing factor PgeF [Alphaproteobacteria bacterium]
MLQKHHVFDFLGHLYAKLTIFIILHDVCKKLQKMSPIVRNRRRVASYFNVSADRLLTLYQIHSPRVVIVDDLFSPDNRPEGDAMVTREKNVALGILTADCVPVLLADRMNGVVGAAHAGWRGALSGVLENTVEAMARLGAQKENIQAALGPCIAQQNYEVGPDVYEAFVSARDDAVRFFAPAPREGHHMFNLPGLVRLRLRQAGVQRVDVPPACTYAEAERFFSYRRTTHNGEAKTGSLISVVMLAG